MGLPGSSAWCTLRHQLQTGGHRGASCVPWASRLQRRWGSVAGQVKTPTESAQRCEARLRQAATSSAGAALWHVAPCPRRTRGKWPRWLPKVGTLPNLPCSSHVPHRSLTLSPACPAFAPLLSAGTRPGKQWWRRRACVRTALQWHYMVWFSSPSLLALDYLGKEPPFGFGAPCWSSPVPN